MSAPKTKYGFPPLPAIKPDFPTRPPYDDEIASLSGFWLEAQCGCAVAPNIPFRLLAAQIGWTVPLRAVLARLRCKTCGEKPKAFALVDNPAHGAIQYGRCMKRLELKAE